MPRRLLRRCIVVFAAIAVLLAIASRPARADDADEADLQFTLGADRYDAGDYQGALEHFLASNRLVPNLNVVFNIARAYEQLKRLPDAYRYYALALEGETNPTQKKRAQEALARITPRVAILRVETNPPGATIFLDRKNLGPRGRAPRALGLLPGKYNVLVELEGHEPAQTAQAIEVVAGQEARVSLELKPILGTVVIDGAPGAEVRIDGDPKPACAEPCSLLLPPGRHAVVVDKRGFVQADYTVDVAVRDRVVLHTKLEPETTSLVVDADIRGALITIDGVAKGFTPAVVTTPVGTHVVRISQAGFRPFEQRVELRAKEQSRVDGLMTAADEVVAASRVSESVDDAPASVTIISTQELRAMAYPTVADAVRGVRGLYLSDDRSYATIGVRGFSRPGDYGNRVLILLDGQPMNDNYVYSSYVGYDGRVDIDDIERIEVIRGPGSVLYGTSAFFGVINLVTRSRNQPTHGEVGIFAADRDRLGRARASAVVQLGKDAGLWLSVSGLAAGGADHYFPEYVSDPRSPTAELDANGRPADGNARNVDGFTAGMVTGRFWFKAFTVQWFLNSRKKTLPTGEYATVFGDPRTHFTDTRAMIEARFEPRLNEETQLLTRAHANLYNFNDYLITPADNGGTQHDVFRGRWGGIEQRLVYTPSPLLRATIGGEVIRHFQTRQAGGSDDGPYVLDDAGNPGRDDPFTVAAGYLLADVAPASMLKISGGARIDYYSSFESFNPGAAINPRLAFILKPREGDNVKLMAGKAFRAPSVYELYTASTLQDRAVKLEPEQIYSVEIEYTHAFSSLVRGTLAGYTNHVNDLIELQDRPGGRTQYANSSSPVQVFGGEAELRREWHGGWMLSATYSLQKATYLSSSELRDVPNSPVHLASAKGAMPIIGRSLVGMTRLSIEGPRPDRNIHVTDPPQGTTDTGVIWDLVLSGEAERLGVRYAIGAYNIMDWRYDAVPSGEFRQRTIVQSGRSILASVSASF